MKIDKNTITAETEKVKEEMTGNGLENVLKDPKNAETALEGIKKLEGDAKGLNEFIKARDMRERMENGRELTSFQQTGTGV